MAYRRVCATRANASALCFDRTASKQAARVVRQHANTVLLEDLDVRIDNRSAALARRPNAAHFNDRFDRVPDDNGRPVTPIKFTRSVSVTVRQNVRMRWPTARSCQKYPWPRRGRSLRAHSFDVMTSLLWPFVIA